MMYLPSLDSHAHIDPARTPTELEPAGAVLVMTLSLEESELMLKRKQTNIAWGIGCHPRQEKAQEQFNCDRFRELALQAAFIGEVGLDSGSRVPLEKQLKTFRQVLSVAAELKHPVSIHSYQATAQVLEELKRMPISVPILHWWTGSAVETRGTAALGCYFSIHSQVARQSKFRLNVPLERILVESDHGWADPLAAIPCRIEWVEHLVAAQRKISREEVRQATWRHLARIIKETGVEYLLLVHIKEGLCC
jgi:TatD DNase family protein